MAIKKLSLSLCPYAMCIGHLLKVECVCKAFCTSFVVQEGLERDKLHNNKMCCYLLPWNLYPFYTGGIKTNVFP